MKLLSNIMVWAALASWGAQCQADDMASPSLAERTELLGFDSISLTDNQFLLGDIRAARPVRLTAQLRLPQGVEKPPVVVLLHGSSGLGAATEHWSRLLNQRGLATVAVDSFSGRGLVSTTRDQGSLGRLNMVIDSYRIRAVLQANPRVDSRRVALLGFSRGGQAALYSSLRRFHRLWNGGDEYQAYLAYYPDCSARYLEDEHLVSAPVRVFHGRADDYNALAPCASYVAELQKQGVDVRLYEYADAHHGFDYPLPLPVTTLQAAQSTRDCRIAEVQPGELINLQSGKPFTYVDSCIASSPHVGANPEAAAAAREQTLAFLCERLGCRP